MQSGMPSRCILGLALWISLAIPATAAPADLAALTEGVDILTAPGLPGAMTAFGPQAFPVVCGASGKTLQPVIVAARYGQGRVVGFGHSSYVEAEPLNHAATARLFQNTLKWVAGGRQPAVVGLYRTRTLGAWLTAQGVENTPVKLDAPLNVPVLILGSADFTAAEQQALQRYVQGGGGLITAATGWGWQQLNPKKDLVQDLALNQLLAPAGLGWTKETLSTTANKGYLVTNALPPHAHAGTALAAAFAQQAGRITLTATQLEQAAATLSMAAQSLPPQDTVLLPQLRQLGTQRGTSLVPTPKTPIKTTNLAARVWLPLQSRQFKNAMPEAIKAHPSAAAFPGAVPPTAPRLKNATVKIDTTVPDWHSLGLYAAPGEVITIQIPATAANQGLGVRIGAHSDKIWPLKSWERFPEISHTWRLDAATTRVASPFGGLIYLTIPRNCPLGEVTATLSGAVSSPLFVAGQTSLTAWREKLRLAPGPWAELASSRVIISLPSQAIRDLDDPEKLMQTWDQIVDACAELAGRPAQRERPERIVTDQQISVGYMHSGYPIMTLMDQIDDFPSQEKLLKGNWGIFHELGHNHQSGDWTFEGATEVTVNWFTLYVYEKVCGIPVKQHPRVSGAARAKTLAKHSFNPMDFEQWKSDPFLALTMYVQLQEAFGWETYRKVIAEYRALPESERPRNDQEKHDQWAVRFSRATGKNLGPFFKTWGLPVTDRALASVASLPAWMPEGFPPR
jgi:hypothetical protein